MKKVLLLIPLLTACDLDLTDLGRCEYDRDFHESINVGTADFLEVIAEAGDLEIVGRAGLGHVEVSGRACADSRRDLDDLEVVLERSGDVIRVLTFVSDRDARIDLVLEVPEYMLAEIDHLEGDIDIWNLSGVSIFDESGHIRLEDIFGDVDIIDGSGNVEARSIDGDVYVEEDGSGDIIVDHVGGNFVVDRDSSGRITYRNVAGRVLLPR